MNSNRFGKIFSITSFGESHGPAMGVVIDGCPAGVTYDESVLLQSLARRRPGQSEIVTSRSETDQPQILSGVFEGKTLGTPIAVVVQNTDARSQDYESIKKNPRPGHADDLWQEKFGHSDPRGGGRASGRETLSRVIGGAFAQMLLQQIHPQLCLQAFTRSLAHLDVQSEDTNAVLHSLLQGGRHSLASTGFPNAELEASAKQLLLTAKSEGKSYGGVAQLIAVNLPPHLGQPVFDKLKSDLARAMMSIGATNGIEFGAGFEAARAEGSEFHRVTEADAPDAKAECAASESSGSRKESGLPTIDKYGGLNGGMSSGKTLSLQVSFKPTSSVLDVAKKGRHDPCIVPRALAVVEAMAYLVLADHVLQLRLDRV